MENKTESLYNLPLKILNNPENFKFEIEKTLAKINILPKMNWDEIEPIFIISTGRTGTKFLAKLFEHFKDMYSIHEPKPSFLKLGFEYAYGNVHELDVINKILRYRTPIYKKLKIKKYMPDIYLESNNRLFSLIKPLIKAFEQPKIIHIVRDGRDFVRSAMSRDYGGPYSKGDKSIRLTAKKFNNDKYKNIWDDMSQFEKICWLWKKKDEIILEDISKYENSKTFKFESIFYPENDFLELKEISNFVGLESEKLLNEFTSLKSKKINKTKNYNLPTWENWDPSLIESFNNIAGEHMKRYGYY